MDPETILATALAALGPWGALAGLAVKFGLPFVEQIITNAHNNVPVTPENWAGLKAKANIPFDALVPKAPAVPA